MAKRTAIQRELRVAFSKQAQPAWVRVLKWMAILGMVFALHGTRYFWYAVVGLPLLGLLVHLFYRWKTNGWTRAWGGWDDVATAQEPARSCAPASTKI